MADTDPAPLPARPTIGAVRGALWMFASGLALVVMAALVRRLTPAFDVLELIFLRNLVSMLILVPWLVRVGAGALRTDRFRLHLGRNGVLYIGNVAWFYAVTALPLADLAALQFSMPLFAIVLAVGFLRETVDARRWLATAVGFVGVLIVVRPGFESVGPGTAAILISAVFYAGAYIGTKMLSSSESGNVVVFYMNAIVLPISLIPALFVWRSPGLDDAAPLILLGITGYLTHYCLTRAFAAADASFVLPFDFLRLPFSAAFGFFLFAERVTLWTWAGAAVIFAASYYLARGETMGKHAREP